MIRALLALTLGGLAATACVPAESCLEGHDCFDRQQLSDDTATSGADGGTDTTPGAPACTVFGKPHIGLGGEDLAAKADGPLGADRARAKPYTALRSEYRRVLGKENAPALIETTGQTFGVPADRWFLEPIASAVFVNTAFDVAFQGCGKLTSAGAKYASAPTKDSARVECSDWARRFWSREATPEQLDACVAVAMETTETDPKRGWVYACASVLTSTGFLTY